MLTSELLAQVRRIEIRTGRLVSETFAGEYLSVFKGTGIEFAEVREYVPGDDVRSIDRNVTARFGRPFVKRYAEERELTVVIACDLSGSLTFGSAAKLKREVAVELAAVLAFSALQNNDKAALALVTDGVERFVPPRKGRNHVLRIVRELLAYEPASRTTSLGRALDTLNRALKRRSIVFLISDFLDSGFEKAFERTAVKHDLIPVVLQDPREAALPRIPVLATVEDPETGERLEADLRPAEVREAFQRGESARMDALRRLFTNCGLDSILIRTDRPFIDPLVRFFEKRAKRFR